MSIWYSCGGPGLRACEASETVPGSRGRWRRFRALVLNCKSRKRTSFGRTSTNLKDFGSFGKLSSRSFQRRHNQGNRSRVLKSYGHLCEFLHTAVNVPQSFRQRGVLLLTHTTTSLLITSTLVWTLFESQEDQLLHTPHQAVSVLVREVHGEPKAHVQLQEAIQDCAQALSHAKQHQDGPAAQVRTARATLISLWRQKYGRPRRKKK